MVRIRSEELNINNRNIILVDDMITTGNSIINAVKILKKINVENFLWFVLMQSYLETPKIK